MGNGMISNSKCVGKQSVAFTRVSSRNLSPRYSHNNTAVKTSLLDYEPINCAFILAHYANEPIRCRLILDITKGNRGKQRQ